MQLEVPIGGVILFAGYPLFKVQILYRGDDDRFDPPTSREARDMASCSDKDMRIFIWHGAKDTIFPVDDAMDRYKKIFK